jgi:hypothetical protein
MSKLKRGVKNVSPLPLLIRGQIWGDIYHSFLAAEMALSVPAAAVAAVLLCRPVAAASENCARV